MSTPDHLHKLVAKHDDEPKLSHELYKSIASSLRQALVLIGPRRLRSWVVLTLLEGGTTTSSSDDLWSVLGTTNIDNRSFEHNDEVNIALRDRGLAARLLEDYVRDIADSREMSLDRWRRRPLWEKVVGPFVWILERQQ